MAKIDWSNPEAKKAHDKEYQRVRRLTQHDKYLESARRWRDTHLPAPIRRNRKWTSLEKDLKILALVIRSEKRKVVRRGKEEKKLQRVERRESFAERNRQRSLAYYHENADKINGLRRFPAIMRAVEREAKKRQSLLCDLESAMRRIDARVQAKKRRITARALRRRFNKGMDRRFALHQKSDYIFRLCGAPLMDVVRHLESLFKPGMTWDNYGFEGWHIDHIKPLAKFDILDPEEQKKCFHFSNLQPLWSSENYAKRDR